MGGGAWRAWVVARAATRSRHRSPLICWRQKRRSWSRGGDSGASAEGTVHRSRDASTCYSTRTVAPDTTMCGVAPHTPPPVAASASVPVPDDLFVSHLVKAYASDANGFAAEERDRWCQLVREWFLASRSPRMPRTLGNWKRLYANPSWASGSPPDTWAEHSADIDFIVSAAVAMRKPRLQQAGTVP